MRQEKERQPFVHEWFHEVARAHPGRIAIEMNGRSVSYRELNNQSNNVARALLDRGAKQSNTVAILAEDRNLVIASIIGILRAGCAFVPIPPNLPDKRVESMLDESRPAYAIVEAAVEERYGALERTRSTSPQIIMADEVCHADESVAVMRPRHPDDFCYIFFTSGLTGKPKGIAGRLKAIDHFVRWEIKTLGLSPETRVSQFTMPSFDAVLRDIFVPLCAGGTICIPPARETVLDGRALADWIEEQGINLIHTVPSVFRNFIANVTSSNQLPNLRHILVAGEPLRPADVGKLCSIFGSRIQIVNLYGPSETTMTKFCYFVQPDDQHRRSIPIGKPIAGARAMLLDKHRKLTPPGAIGEIYIRTPYRSLGYFEQPDATSQVFLQNPYSQDNDDILYKTGDLARTLDDGNFEFLGRCDDQIKVRGVRIEIGEIESVLAASDLTRDAAVLPHETVEGDTLLSCYVVPKNGATVEAIRGHLALHLPPEVVPSTFTLLERLPLTPHGKVDRAALSQMAAKSSFSAEGARSLSQVEEIIAGIWSEVLHVGEINRQDSFFELGGHSLLATRMISQLQDEFGVQLPLRALFDAPVLSQLAARVEKERWQDLDKAGFPLLPAAPNTTIPLSRAQRRLWALEQINPGTPVYNCPAAVQIVGKLSVKTLARSLARVSERHEVLRATFHNVDGEAVARVANSGRIALPVIDFAGLPGFLRQRAADRIMKAEAVRLFNLGQGPLMRACLLKLDADEYILTVNIHHIVSDALSIRIFFDEVVAIYIALSSGQTPRLPELPAQYSDFATWEKNWIESGGAELKLAYWRQQLTDVQELRLPIDHPIHDNSMRAAEKFRFTLSTDVAAGLNDLSQRYGVTLFMTLLAAFKVLLYRFTGQCDLVVISSTAIRNHVAIEPLIGLFVNQLPLRTNLAGNPSFSELLMRARETVLDAHAYGDVPFELIIDAIGLERHLGHSPLFQVGFILHRLHRATPLQVPGIQISDMSIYFSPPRFDFGMELSETLEGLTGSFVYSTNLFKRETIAELADTFHNIVDAMLLDQDRPILDKFVDNLTEQDGSAPPPDQHGLESVFSF